MSAGGRVRLSNDRKRRLHHRDRIHALKALLWKRADEATTRAASLKMIDEGAPARLGD
jgi:hypothetical protein